MSPVSLRSFNLTQQSNVIKMLTKWTGTWGDFLIFNLLLYGPPGGCGALSSHVISWCLRPALRPAQVKHVLPLVLTILYRIFTAGLQCELLIKCLIFETYTSLLVTYSVYILLCRHTFECCVILVWNCIILHLLHRYVRSLAAMTPEFFLERNSDLWNTGVTNNTCITVYYQLH